ncbi:MAG: T9SS type A sorting domain-containing protein [Haliscomenobacter sp.]|nr:T9SS type A sorting domain-containing protein [Haliscomenobacter sp.]
MKWRFVISLLGAFSWLPLFMQAQSIPCIFTLELTDANGQGWQGASLELRIRQKGTIYTLEEGQSTSRFFIPAYTADTLTLQFLPGANNEGVSFTVYHPDGAVLFTGSGTQLPAGEVLRQLIACPSCPIPPVLGVQIGDVRAFTADIRWIRPDTTGKYLLEIDTAGFTRGKGKLFQVTSDKLKVTGLKENTAYQFYLSVRCSAKGDTSQVIGPFSFKTLWANDVGVAEIFAPQSGCDLGADSIKVGIGNYGGEPQTFIPFLYAVNGRKANIDMPKDGMYTGVIGKDSIEEATFDLVYNFGAPGEYIVQAWTELKADSVSKNDTSSLLVVHAPTINSLPYFVNLDQGFTGWYPDQNSTPSSWGLGYPNGRVLHGAFSGQRAWTTSLKGGYSADEWSYLLSPCLDFSTLTKDPTLSFAMRVDAEICCDGAWVEMSLDAGKTWSLLGLSSSGINWYNNSDRQVWTGNGGAPGWFQAAHPLAGAAGMPDVRLRFVFRADYNNHFDGIAVDNIRIDASTLDVAALQVRNNGGLTCGSPTDQVVLSIGNLGATATATGIQAAYSVNNGPAVQENVASMITPGQKLDFSFITRFNSQAPGAYTIKAWVKSADGTPANDTIFYTFYSAQPLPFAEDFERGALPKEWTIDQDVIVSNGRNNASYVVSDNLFTNDRTMQATTPAFGPIAKGDSLVFDYRFTNFVGNGSQGTQLGPNDRLEIQVSTDCGTTFRTVSVINNQNHIASAVMKKVSVKLDTFNGQYIRVRFLATWGQGDYFVDLDNIQVLRCPASLDLSIVVSPSNLQPRTATVLSKSVNGPFQYQWNTGATNATATLPSGGFFEVTVTDRYGCRDIASTLVTSANEVLEVEKFLLAPNPSTGLSRLLVQFPEALDAQVQIISMYGQLLRETRFGRTSEIQMDIPLEAYPGGVFFIRVVAGNKSRTERLIRTR